MATCVICGDKVALGMNNAAKEARKTLERLELIRANLIAMAQAIERAEASDPPYPDWLAETRALLTSDDTKHFIRQGERFVKGWHDLAHKRSNGPTMRETARWIEASHNVLQGTTVLAVRAQTYD